MANTSLFLVTLVASFHLSLGQWNNAGPGTNFFWPRFNYTNKDIKYKTELTLHNNYVCKWDVTIPGMNMNQGILILPPCTYITPHWHSDTYELNFIMQGEMTYWVYAYASPGKPTIPLHGKVAQGSALVSPLGLMHLLYNDQCDILAMMHSFPSSTNEDFFSAWANLEQTTADYDDSVMPKAPGGAGMMRSLNIPDGVHTVSKQCTKRCGLTKHYYENFVCPKDIPFKTEVLKSFTPKAVVV
jgi:hypothetical protein